MIHGKIITLHFFPQFLEQRLSQFVLDPSWLLFHRLGTYSQYEHELHELDDRNAFEGQVNLLELQLAQVISFLDLRFVWLVSYLNEDRKNCEYERETQSNT